MNISNDKSRSPHRTEAQIRAAEIKDSAAIAQLHVGSWQTTYRGQLPEEFLAKLSVNAREQMWRESLAQGTDTVLLATRQSQLLGFVSFGPSRDTDAAGTATGEIYAIYLSAEAQGRGVGKQLWRAACGELRARGFSEAAVWVLDTNQTARAFYRRMGGHEDGGYKRCTIGGKEVGELRYRVKLAS